MPWGPTTDKGTVDGLGVVVASITNDSTHGTWAPGAFGIGDRIVVRLNFNGSSSSGTTATITDSLGNTYNEDTASTAGGATTERDSTFSGNVTVAGTPTYIKATMVAGTAGMELNWTRYTSLLTTAGAGAAVDKSIVGQGANGQALSGNTGATTAANELVIGGYGDVGSSTAMAGKNGTGFTERSVGKTSADAQTYIEDKDSGATGVQSSSMVAGFPGGASADWYMHCIVYKLAPTTATIPNKQFLYLQAVKQAANY